MTLYSPGDHSSAICHDCSALVTTVFHYRDVPIEGSDRIVKDLLAAVCTQCNAVVALPAQSTPAVRQASDHALIPLEVVLSSRELEILDLASTQINPSAGTRLRKLLIVSYLNRLDRESNPLTLLIEEPASKASQASPKKRLSMKISRHTEETLTRVMTTTQLSKSALIRRITQLILHELILEQSTTAMRRLKEDAALWIA